MSAELRAELGGYFQTLAESRSNPTARGLLHALQLG